MVVTSQGLNCESRIRVNLSFSAHHYPGVAERLETMDQEERTALLKAWCVVGSYIRDTEVELHAITRGSLLTRLGDDPSKRNEVHSDQVITTLTNLLERQSKRSAASAKSIKLQLYFTPKRDSRIYSRLKSLTNDERQILVRHWAIVASGLDSLDMKVSIGAREEKGSLALTPLVTTDPLPPDMPTLVGENAMLNEAQTSQPKHNDSTGAIERTGEMDDFDLPTTGDFAIG